MQNNGQCRVGRVLKMIDTMKMNNFEHNLSCDATRSGVSSGQQGIRSLWLCMCTLFCRLKSRDVDRAKPWKRFTYREDKMHRSRNVLNTLREVFQRAKGRGDERWEVGGGDERWRWEEWETDGWSGVDARSRFVQSHTAEPSRLRPQAKKVKIMT